MYCQESFLKNNYLNTFIENVQSPKRIALSSRYPYLKIAASKLDKIIIKPGQTFSFWHLVGRPSAKRGFVNGMLLSNGKVVEGLGGGLCQMANLLYWMFLHAPVEIKQRYHHSLDVFPDSGRTLPFGSGATVLYNFVDLKIKNISPDTLQLKIWLTDNHLKGQLLSDKKIESKFHIYEKKHCFIEREGKYYRFNEIWREEKVQGEIINNQKIIENFAPVLYEVNDNYLKENNYKLIR